MSFWDTVGSLMGSVVATGQEIQRYQREYESMSDDSLKREYRKLMGMSWKNTENLSKIFSNRLKSVKI